MLDPNRYRTGFETVQTTLSRGSQLPPLSTPYIPEIRLHMQRGGEGRLLPVVGSPMGDSDDRRRMRELNQYLNGVNNLLANVGSGLLWAGEQVGLSSSSEGMLDVYRRRGMEHILNATMTADERLRHAALLDRTRNPWGGGDVLGAILEREANYTIDGAALYRDWAEENPLAAHILAVRGYEEEQFAHVKSGLQMRVIIYSALMKQEAEDAVQEEWDTYGMGPGFRAFMDQHFLTDPVSTLSLFVSPYILGANRTLGQFGAATLRGVGGIQNPIARNMLSVPGHTLMGASRATYSLQTRAAMKMGYGTVVGVELAAFGAALDAFDQFIVNKQVNQIFEGLPDEATYDPWRTIAAAGLTGALGVAIGKFAYGRGPAHHGGDISEGFAHFVTGGRTFRRRDHHTPGSTEKAMVMAGDDIQSQSILGRVKTFVDEATPDADLALFIDDHLLGRMGLNKGVVSMWLDVVGEAIPAGQRMNAHQLREALFDFATDYNRRQLNLLNPQELGGVRYNAYRQRVERRLLGDTETEGFFKRVLAPFLKQNAIAAGLVANRNIPGTAEFANRVHRRTVAMLRHRQARLAKRQVDDALSPPEDRASQYLESLNRNHEAGPSSGTTIDPWVYPVRTQTEVPAELIRPNPARPADDYNAELIGSMLEDEGFLSTVARTRPIEVERMADGTLQIVDGHNRFATMFILGEESVPVVIVRSAEEPPVDRLYRSIQTSPLGPNHPNTASALQRLEDVIPDASHTAPLRDLPNHVSEGSDIMRAVGGRLGLSSDEANIVARALDARADAWAEITGASRADYFQSQWRALDPTQFVAKLRETAALHNQMIRAADSADPEVLDTTLRMALRVLEPELPRDFRIGAIQAARRFARKQKPKSRLAKMSDADVRNASVAPVLSDPDVADMMFHAFRNWSRTGNSANQSIESMMQMVRWHMKSMYDDITGWKMKPNDMLSVESDFDKIFSPILNKGDGPARAARNLSIRLNGEDAPPHIRARVQHLKDELDYLRERSGRGLLTMEEEIRAEALMLALEEAGLEVVDTLSHAAPLAADGMRRSQFGTFFTDLWAPVSESGRLLQQMVRSAGDVQRLGATLSEMRAAVRTRPTPVRDQPLDEVPDMFRGREADILRQGPESEVGGLVREARATLDGLRTRAPRPGREARHAQEVQKWTDRTEALENIYETRFGRVFEPEVRAQPGVIDDTPAPVHRARDRQERAVEKDIKKAYLDQTRAFDALHETAPPIDLASLPPTERYAAAVARMEKIIEGLPHYLGAQLNDGNMIQSTLESLGLNGLIQAAATSRSGHALVNRSGIMAVRLVADLLDNQTLKMTSLLNDQTPWTANTLFGARHEAMREIFSPVLQAVNQLQAAGRLKGKAEQDAFVSDLYRHALGVKASEDEGVLAVFDVLKQTRKAVLDEARRVGYNLGDSEYAIPIRWNQARIRQDASALSEEIRPLFHRRWTEGDRKDEVLQEALVDLGWARRIVDEDNNISFVATDKLPKRFNEALPQKVSELGDDEALYRRALDGNLPGVEKPALQRLSDTSVQRMISLDTFEYDARGNPVTRRGSRAHSGRPRALELSPDDIRDGNLIDWMDMNIVQTIDHYAGSVGTAIKAQAAVQRLPGAVKGVTTVRHVVDAAERVAERAYRAQNLDTSEVHRAFAAIREKVEWIHGRRPRITSTVDGVGEVLSGVGRHSAGVLYSAGVVPLAAATEGIRSLITKAYTPGQLLDNVREAVRALAFGHGAKSHHRVRLLDTATGSRLYRGAGIERFTADSIQTSVALSAWDRQITPWKEVLQAFNDTTLSLPKRLGNSLVLATRAAATNMGAGHGLNVLTNGLRAQQIYVIERELATFLPAMRRLAARRVAEQENLSTAYDTAYQAARGRGLSAAKAQREGEIAMETLFRSIAREEGFGSQWHLAQRYAQDGLLDAQGLDVIDELVRMVGARVGRTENRLTGRPHISIPELAEAALELPVARQRRAQEMIRRMSNHLDNHLIRFLNEPSPWTAATDVASRTHWGSVSNAFLGFARSAAVNIGISGMQSPANQTLALLLIYTWGDYMGQVARRLAKGEAPDSIMQDWEDNPIGTFTRIAARWPGFGLYSGGAEDLLNAVLGDVPRKMAGGGPGQSAMARLYETSAHLAASPVQALRGEEITGPTAAANAVRSATMFYGLAERGITGEWPVDRSRFRKDVLDAESVIERLFRANEAIPADPIAQSRLSPEQIAERAEERRRLHQALRNLDQAIPPN